MKNGLTYIIFVIDRSGSMESIRTDMIGGFNSFIKSQQDAKLGDCRVFAYKFDTQYEAMFEDVDLNKVSLLNLDNYIPRGGTALYDSLGKTIIDIGTKLSAMKEEDRPEKVLVITITDGEDNSHLVWESLITGDSLRFDSTKVKEMVEHQKLVYSWDFAYIGANQDSWAVASSMGYSVGTTMDYEATPAGTALAFAALDNSALRYRSAAPGAKFSFSPSEDESDVHVTTSSKKSSVKKK